MKQTRRELANFLFISFTLVFSHSILGADSFYNAQKLTNGLEVITYSSPKVPLVTLLLTFRAGAKTETSEINGLTHVWEHMFFKGNRTIPNEEAFQKRLRQLGIVHNGFTSTEQVSYFFTLPSAFLEEGVKFMADAIIAPLLDPKELERERRVVLDEYDRNASEPDFVISKIKTKLIYGDQSHRLDPLGVRALIERATRKQMFRIKNEVFVPSNGALFLAGDVDSKTANTLAEKYFKEWKNPKNWKPVNQKSFPAFPETTTVVNTNPHAQNVSIKYSFQGPRAKIEVEDTYVADVLATLLQHRSGRFYKDFIDSGVSLGAGLGYYTQGETGELIVYGSTTAKEAKTFDEKILGEVSEWQKPDYFSKEQLDDVRRRLLIDKKYDLNRPSAFVKNLAFWWAVTDLNYFDGYIENMQKVDLKDVAKFAKKYFEKKNYVKTVLLNPQDIKATGFKDNSTAYVKKFNIKATKVGS